MVPLEREIDYGTRIELVLADVIAERVGVELVGSRIVVERRTEKELVLGAREDGEGGLPGDLGRIGARSASASSVAKPRSSASTALLVRMTTPLRPSTVKPRKLV
jgi:hypothetical protein